MKRFVAIIFLLGSLASVAFSAPAVIKGDINGDGRVTIADVRILLKLVMKPDSATSAQKVAADVDGDGKITLKDARLLLQRAS